MAKNDLIMFGDGMQALYYDEKNVVRDIRGIKMIPILLFPSEELKKKYGVKDEDLNVMTEDGRKAMWMEYPQSQMDWLIKSKSGSVLLIWCNFNAEKTKIMNKMEDLFEVDQIRDMKESLIEGHNITLIEELKESKQDMIELARKNKELMDVFTSKKEKEGEEDENEV